MARHRVTSMALGISAVLILGGNACHRQAPGTAASADSAPLAGVTDIDRHSPDGTITRLQGNNLSQLLEEQRSYQDLREQGAYSEMAMAFLERYRNEFRLTNPTLELRERQVQSDELGYHQVRFLQVFEEYPVVDAEIIVHFNPDNHVYLVQGQYVPTPGGLDLTPDLTLEQVQEHVRMQLGEIAFAGNDEDLVVFSAQDQARLAYRFVARRSPIDSWLVIADADSGQILRKTPTTYQNKPGDRHDDPEEN